MAKQLVPEAPAMGRLILVKNRRRVFGSAPEYYAVHLESNDSKVTKCCLFTEAEIARAVLRSNRNPEDLTKLGFRRNRKR